MAASTCVSPTCGHVSHEGAKRCPACAKPMYSARAIRLQGWVLLVLSAVLLGLLGYVAVEIWPLLTGASPPGGPTFTGTREQAETGLTVLAGAIAFSIGMGAMGLVQVIAARRHRWLTIAVFAMVVLFVLLVRYAQSHI
jgi:hypothetical protein